MEELLKQAENGCNFRSMLEPSLSNIIKEIDNLKLKYHLVDTAKRNTEQSKPSLSELRQNQTKDNSTQHEVTNNKDQNENINDDQVESKDELRTEKHFDFNDINQVTECLIEAWKTNNQQRGYLTEQNALIKRLFERNNHLISLLREEQLEKLELKANMITMDQERIRLMDELKVLKQNSNAIELEFFDLINLIKLK